MIFRAKKDPWVGVVYLIIIIFCVGIMGLIVNDILRHGHNGLFFLLIILLLVEGALLWLWFDTKYMIMNDQLEYHSGPFRGKVAINKISRIITNKTLWVGVRKPALARNGMIIHYDKWETVYIAPLDQKGIIDALLAVNPGIVIE